MTNIFLFDDINTMTSKMARLLKKLSWTMNDVIRTESGRTSRLQNRTRGIRKRKLRDTLKRIAKHPILYGTEHFGSVWSKHKALAVESTAFDIDTFVESYKQSMTKFLQKQLIGCCSQNK